MEAGRQKMRNRFRLLPAVAALLLLLSGCGGQKTESTAAPETTAAVQASETAGTAAAETTEALETTAAPEVSSSGSDSGSGGVADRSQMTEVKEVGEEGAEPVYAASLKDGRYEISVECSSSMFRITDCALTVDHGAMTAEMTLSGSSYSFVYPGTAEEAAAADESAWIPAGESPDGKNTFVLPLEALNQDVLCAAFSKNKQLWYDRTLWFSAESLPAEAFQEGFFATAESLGIPDGSYTAEVTLSGGSGRSSVASPARIEVKDGKAEAEIIWSSANYDYMIVDGEKFLAEIVDGHSVFRIPVPYFDRAFSAPADTTAMSTPHEIEYTLKFDLKSVSDEAGNVVGAGEGAAAGASADAGAASGEGQTSGPDETEKSEKAEEKTGEKTGESARPEESSGLLYAREFTMEDLSDGCTLVTIGGTDRFLVVPEGKEPADPKALSAESGTDGSTKMVVLHLPLDKIYAADSSAVDLFRHAGAMPSLRFTSTGENDWSIPDVRKEMEAGHLLYAGKYSAPDYELLLSEGCSLAVENTMIYHSPETKEQLEALGIPVLVERSSYEPHPLGRMEWIRLYGLLSGHREEADRFFMSETDLVRGIPDGTGTGKSAVFFYLSSNGYVNVRRPEDYLPKMIELAGGHYALSEALPPDGSARSTMNMQTESFYAAAKDADVLIYNSNVDGGVKSIAELLEKAAWLSDFSAVRSGNAWCAEQSLFQETSGIAGMIADLHEIFSGEADGKDALRYFKRLE